MTSPELIDVVQSTLRSQAAVLAAQEAVLTYAKTIASALDDLKTRVATLEAVVATLRRDHDVLANQTNGHDGR